MPGVAVVGTQWGDEGKGKVVDLLAPRFHTVARFGGGHNAGHTVVAEGRKLVLHLLPSAVLHPGVRSVIGNGCVVDPEACLTELDEVEAAGFDPTSRLLFSERAHCILNVHREVEALEESLRGRGEIGTTRRGIGPAYEDKAGRRGLRLADLRDRDQRDGRLAHLMAVRGRLLGWGRDRQREEARAAGATLDRFADRALALIGDASLAITEALAAGHPVLFEGAQAALLDIDHGSYPFVTSSSAVAAGAAVGSGVGPAAVGRVLGVAKAYQTRVGGGPMPTEMTEAENAEVVRRGNEYGASTGRPRRCGWFDAVVLRYSRRVHGLDELAITKLDVLDGFSEIRVAVRYRLDGGTVSEFPADAEAIGRCLPEYRTFAGWRRPTAGVTRMKDLPRETRVYLDALEELTGVPITLASTGPDRLASIRRARSRIFPPGDRRSFR